MNSCGRIGLFLVGLAVAGCSSAPVPTPAFRYANEGGCGNIFLHKGSADSREVLWISADSKALRLPEKGEVVFDLAKAPAGLEVAIDLWEKTPKHSPYCNDIADDTRKLATWKATRGKLTLTIQARDPQTKHYKANARLEDVEFDDGTGNKATLKGETITDALVGWYAG